MFYKLSFWNFSCIFYNFPVQLVSVRLSIKEFQKRKKKKTCNSGHLFGIFVSLFLYTGMNHNIATNQNFNDNLFNQSAAKLGIFNYLQILRHFENESKFTTRIFQNRNEYRLSFLNTNHYSRKSYLSFEQP